MTLYIDLLLFFINYFIFFLNLLFLSKKIIKIFCANCANTFTKKMCILAIKIIYIYIYNYYTHFFANFANTFSTFFFPFFYYLL